MPITLIDVIKASQKPASDRTARYAARLDAHLDTIPPADRGPFLHREHALWETRYRNWARAVDAGQPDLGYSAWDFTLTIAEIDKRRAPQLAVVQS